MAENGKFALTRKEVEFLRAYTLGGKTQVAAAQAAGYAQKSAAQSANRILKKISRTPSQYWVSLLNLSGVDLATCARELSAIVGRKSEGARADKNKILAIQMVLSAHGIGSTKDTAESNTFNIQGPVMVIMGEEEKRAALREGSPKLEAVKPEDAV